MDSPIPALRTLAEVAVTHHFANSMGLPAQYIAQYERVLGRRLQEDELATMETAWNSLGRRRWKDVLTDQPSPKKKPWDERGWCPHDEGHG